MVAAPDVYININFIFCWDLFKFIPNKGQLVQFGHSLFTLKFPEEISRLLPSKTGYCFYESVTSRGLGGMYT